MTEEIATRPGRARVFAVAVVGVEGLAAFVAGIGFTVAALVGSPQDRGTAVFLGALVAVFGLGLLALARSLRRGSRWPRTPAYLAQFFGLVVAWYQRSTLPVVSIALLVVCGAAVVALVQSSASRPSRS